MHIQFVISISFTQYYTYIYINVKSKCKGSSLKKLSILFRLGVHMVKKSRRGMVAAKVTICFNRIWSNCDSVDFHWRLELYGDLHICVQAHAGQLDTIRVYREYKCLRRLIEIYVLIHSRIDASFANNMHCKGREGHSASLFTVNLQWRLTAEYIWTK